MKKNKDEISLSPEDEKDIIGWVCEQIDTALKDRAKLQNRWAKWIEQYEEILPETKDFPWEGCSNISLPLSAIAVETIHSREVNTLFSIHPYIQVKAKKKGVDPNSVAQIERFLEQVLISVVDLYDTGSQWLLEKNKMGTSFLKPYWCYEKRKVGKSNFQEIDDVKAEVVAIEDLVFPTGTKDLQTTPWVAQRIKPHWNDLKAKEKMGIYSNVDKIKNSPNLGENPDGIRDLTRVKEKAEDTQRTSPNTLKEYTIYEVYLDYDVDGDGFTERTVLTIHKESRTKLRWIYFPYKHGRRPFIKNVYQSRVGRVYGKGICEQSEHLSDAINTAFNQTIDNMTIANVKCFKRRRGTEAVGRVFPGKTFILDDITDLQEFSLGEVHQSNFVLHSLLRDYHERRTKVTDYTLGKESSTMKSRATATGTLALLQESGRHFDLVINNSRKALAELAYQVIELYAQYRPEKVFTVDGGDSMEDVMLPDIDLSNLRETYNFTCAATSLSVNKEIEKQSNLMLLQTLGGIFSQMIQLISTVMAPQVQIPEELKQFVYGVIRSYYTMAQDLVRSFEKIDVTSYLPELPEVVKEAYGQGNKVAEFMQRLGGMVDAQSGAGTSPGGLAEVGGMAAMFGGNTGSNETGFE